MDPEVIRRLVRIAEEEQIAGLTVETEGARISFQRLVSPGTAASVGVTPAGAVAVQPRPAIAPPAGEEAKPEGAREGWRYLTAPMVGIFRRRSGLEADVAARVGDEVAAGAVVCYIESMNIMNEVRTDVPGRIVEIAIQDGEPVEYGQPLMLLHTE